MPRKESYQTLNDSTSIVYLFKTLTDFTHSFIFQFHVFYAAYVSYLIKRIWYGMVFTSSIHRGP